ncbi:hypothetical protein PQX77_008839 [Marasmius sp. AFHP31]|nr:hypothetical protein PQX77_008839 [Marasmius sp. AFHP31]
MRSFLLFFLTFITVVTAGVIPRAEDAPDLTPNRSRMLMYFNRNSAMSFEEFSDYWRGPHAQLFLNTTVAKQNLLRYEQMHVNQEWKQKLREEGLDVPEFDGIMLAEAASMDKIFEAFNNEEYNEIVIPDSLKFSNFSTALISGFKISTVFDRHPREIPDEQVGVIRKDFQTLVGDFTHKEGMEYGDFVKYWSEVNTPRMLRAVRETGADRVFSKYELNTLDPVKPTVDNPFTSFDQQWDAIAMMSGPTVGEVVDQLKNRRILDFVRKDAPNFADVQKGIEFVPCDVVSFKIPEA